MNFNERYKFEKIAHEGSHPWPNENSQSQTIRHIVTHHKSSIKNFVTDLTNLFNEKEIPKEKHPELLNRLLPELVKSSIDDGKISLPALLDVHDTVHDRQDKPNRGIDVVFENSSDKIKAIKDEVQRDHQHE